MSLVKESEVSLLAEGTRIEGKVTFDQTTRLFGTIVGDVIAIPGSELILGDTGVIEGNIEADVLMINGFVNGHISAKTRVMISRSGRVIGNIQAPSLIMEFGAYFEGRCLMENSPSTSITSNPSPLPA